MYTALRRSSRVQLCARIHSSAAQSAQKPGLFYPVGLCFFLLKFVPIQAPRGRVLCRTSNQSRRRDGMRWPKGGATPLDPNPLTKTPTSSTNTEIDQADAGTGDPRRNLTRRKHPRRGLPPTLSSKTIPSFTTLRPPSVFRHHA